MLKWFMYVYECMLYIIRSRFSLYLERIMNEGSGLHLVSLTLAESRWGYARLLLASEIKIFQTLCETIFRRSIFRQKRENVINYNWMRAFNTPL